MADDWYTAFVRWAHKPSPTGEWVYRGQAARFPTVVPSLMRSGWRDTHQSRELFDIDYDIARAVFDSSPTFGAAALHPVIDDALGEHIEGLAAMMGSAPSIHPEVSFAELVRALAQHYDYPTFFIDVSFHPLVSALFASHRFGPDGYRDSEEAGVLYRWPVERKSDRRCTISGSVDGEAFEIGVIDIRGVHELARRPSTQYAALATPVHDPKPVYQPFQTAIDRLECVDMSALDCCECFELPPGAAPVLSEQSGATIDGLFPDRLDLGFSYLAVIALLSLTTHRAKTTDGEIAARLNAMFDRMVNVARALLDRECFRLDVHAGVTMHARRYSLVDLQGEVHLQAERARAAVAYMQTTEGTERALAALEKEQARIQEVSTARFDAWQDAVRSVVGDDVAERLEAPRYTFTRGDHDWVLVEIDRRLGRVEPILNTADWLPLWALERGHELRAVLHTDDEYETALRQQLLINRATVEALGRFGC